MEMDLHTIKKRRRRAVKVVLTDVLMVVAVMVIAPILIMVVMGYKISKDGKLEQSGLVQVESRPVRAMVLVDGEEVAMTNTNKMLSSGEHEILLRREGYYDWQKKIEVKAGWLLQLEYPRLYKKERKTEKMMKLEQAKCLFGSPNREKMIYGAMEDGRLAWGVISVNGEKIKEQRMDFTGVFGVSRIDENVQDEEEKTEEDRLTVGMVEDLEVVEWDKSGNKVLVKYMQDGAEKWTLLDLVHGEESVNLTEKFGMNFSKMRIENDGAGRLLAIENGNLRELNLENDEVSKVLLTEIKDFNNDGTRVGYITKKGVAGVYKVGEKGATELTEAKRAEAIAIGEYRGEAYLAYVRREAFCVYAGVLPSFGEKMKMRLMNNEKNGCKKDEKMGGKVDGGERVAMDALVEEANLGGRKSLTLSGNQRFILERQAESNEMMVFDMEDFVAKKYAVKVEFVRWLSNYELFGVDKAGVLKVWDFDGANQRDLGKAMKHKDMMISRNDKWMYTLRKGALVKEEL